MSNKSMRYLKKTIELKQTIRRRGQKDRNYRERSLRHSEVNISETDIRNTINATEQKIPHIA